MKKSLTSEFELIDSLLRAEQHEANSAVLGPGDDCAVIPGSDKTTLVTVDALVDGIHFNRSHSSYYDIGWKLLAVSVSDVAAMGGVGEFFFVSLQIDSSVNQEQLKELYSGIYDLADELNINVLGGDTVNSNTFVVSGTLLGSCEQDPVQRSGANIGDLIWVNGVLGEAAAGLALLDGKLDSNILKSPEVCIQRHRQPGISLSTSFAPLTTAMIDISDGLFQDALHLSRRSDVDILFEMSELPNPFCRKVENPLFLKTISGGDDYRLLFTSPSECRERLDQINGLKCVGRVIPKTEEVSQVFLCCEDKQVREVSELFAQYDIVLGYQHKILS